MNHQAETQRGVVDVESAIRNPSNPDHFMVIEPIDWRVRIFSGDALLAETTDAVRLIEVGNKAYAPLIYVPAEGLCQPLERTDKTSHCPLKGDASYFAFRGEEIGWAYLEPFDFAGQLAGRHAFWPMKVRVEEGG